MKTPAQQIRDAAGARLAQILNKEFTCPPPVAPTLEEIKTAIKHAEADATTHIIDGDIYVDMQICIWKPHQLELLKKLLRETSGNRNLHQTKTD